MLDAVQLSFISSVGEDELTHADRIAAGKGAKRLLAVVLRQALVDEQLAQQGALPDKYWPWNGQWTPEQELDAFWSSDWLASICLYLDLEAGDVVDYVQEVRDGTETVETDKRRAVRTGRPGT